MEQWPEDFKKRRKAMAKSKYVNVGQFSSVRKLTLTYPKSKYDRAAMTIDSPFVAAVPPESR